jgi:hypothetical protein
VITLDSESKISIAYLSMKYINNWTYISKACLSQDVQR